MTGTVVVPQTAELTFLKQTLFNSPISLLTQMQWDAKADVYLHYQGSLSKL